MKKLVLVIAIIMISFNSEKSKPIVDFTTIFEKSGGTETATYQQTIKYYSDLADAYKEISISYCDIKFQCCI